MRKRPTRVPGFIGYCFSLTLTIPEREAIEAKARDCGRTPGAFVREVILQAIGFVHPPPPSGDKP